MGHWTSPEIITLEVQLYNLHWMLERDEAGGGFSTIPGSIGLASVDILSIRYLLHAMKFSKGAEDICCNNILMVISTLYAWLNFLKHSRLLSHSMASIESIRRCAIHSVAPNPQGC